VVEAISDALSRHLDLAHGIRCLEHESDAVLDSVEPLLLDGYDDLAILDYGDRAVVPHVDAEVIGAHLNRLLSWVMALTNVPHDDKRSPLTG
jgi:hypothetical protein